MEQKPACPWPTEGEALIWDCHHKPIPRPRGAQSVNLLPKKDKTAK
jgi:hypothetical protein